MNFLIISGLSGAGKSRCIATLEDFGYNCIDNVPPRFIRSISLNNLQNRDLALVVDARSQDIETFVREIDKLRNDHISFKLLFIDCSDQELLNRYKETRRKHPLLSDTVTSVEQAIDLEREMLQEVREKADYTIDTTFTDNKQFRQHLLDLISTTPLTKLQLKLVSFGYKYGIPSDADILFDVRCLPNPYYVEDLKTKTGLDDEVYDYVFSFETARITGEKIIDLLKYDIPLYIEEGKTQLVVAMGCTGGKHRSISFVRYLEKNLKMDGVETIVLHRDVERDD